MHKLYKQIDVINKQTNQKLCDDRERNGFIGNVASLWNADCIVLRLFQTIAWGGWFHFFISKKYIIRSVRRDTCFLWTSIYISWFISQQLISIDLSGRNETKGSSQRFRIDVWKHLNKLAIENRSRVWKYIFKPVAIMLQHSVRAM